MNLLEDFETSMGACVTRIYGKYVTKLMDFMLKNWPSWAMLSQKVSAT